MKYEDILEAKKLLEATDHRDGFVKNPKYREIFALFMMKHGYNCEYDYMIIPEKILPAIQEYYKLPFPSYVRVMNIEDFDKIVFIKGFRLPKIDLK